MPDSYKKRPRKSFILKLFITLFFSLSIIAIKLIIPPLGYRVPYLLILFSVVISAYFGGFWQGILSTVITGLLANYFFYKIPYEFDFSSPEILLRTVAFIIEGIVVSWLAEVQRKTNEKNEQLAVIIETTKDAVIGKTLDDIIISWNKGAEKIYGFAAKDIIGKSANIIIPPEARKEEEMVLEKIRNKVSVKARESIRLTKDGRKIWVSITSSPVFDRNGNVIGLSTIARDITKNKETDLQIKEQAELLRLSHDAIIVQEHDRNHKNKINYWNNGAVALYGYSQKEAVGKIATELLKTIFPLSIDEIHNFIMKNKFWEGELIHTTKSGKRIVVESRWAFISYKGRNLQVLEINRDVTQRKKLETKLHNINKQLELKVEKRTMQLSTANKRLQRSNKELEDFAYIASHDLQEPLRKIQSFGNLIIEETGNLPEDGKTYLDRILNAASRMRLLIDNLLSYSRVISKALPFQNTDLNEIANSVISDLEVRIKEAKAIIEIDNLPVIEADPLQMRQLFQNIIGNALKYKRKNTAPVVKVYTRHNKSDTISQKVVHICFEDNGIGIEEKYIDRIFTIFERLHSRSEYEGTGIGLAVVRKIIDRHNGSIKVESKLNKGSIFIVTLPVKQNTQGGEEYDK